jgi:hypothetical protein
MDRSEEQVVSGSYLLQTAQADSFGTLTRTKDATRRDSVATASSSCSDVFCTSPLVFHPISGKPNLTISTSFEEEEDVGQHCMPTPVVTHTLFGRNHDIEGRYARPNIFAQLMLEYERDHDPYDQKALTTSPCREQHDPYFPEASKARAHKHQRDDSSASCVPAKKTNCTGVNAKALLTLGARIMSCLWTKTKIVPSG